MGWRMKLGRKITLFAVLAMVLAGCPSLWNAGKTEKQLSPEEMFRQAEDNFKSKDYPQAIELYERLKSAHPDFNKMPEVYMKLADASFEQGAYEKAASRYLQFMELYPAHKDIPRAKYQVAMCYFNQIKNTDLDSRAIKQALDSFKLVADNPNSEEWGKKAEEKKRECLKKLAEKEIYKARTYVSVGNYNAARLAAQRVLEEFPKMGFDEKAKELIDKIKGK